MGGPAPDIRGLAPDGSLLELSMDGDRVLLLFLTSSCYECVGLWNQLAARPAGLSGSRVVLVTPSPSTESAADVTELAPGGLEVVMASEAWHAYRVTLAPWCVVAAGGVVVADRPAPPTWDELVALLADLGS
jgi:hypothetical protein